MTPKPAPDADQINRVVAAVLRSRDTDAARHFVVPLINERIAPVLPDQLVASERTKIALGCAVAGSYLIGRLPVPRLRVVLDALRAQPWKGPRWIGAPWVFETACVVAAMSTPVHIRPDGPAWSAWRDYHLASGEWSQIARWAEAENTGVLQEWRDWPPTISTNNGSEAVH
jgi:hypothetical protein